MGWENLLGYMLSSLLPKIRLCRGNFSQQDLKKISRTVNGLQLYFSFFQLVALNILILYELFRNFESFLHVVFGSNLPSRYDHVYVHCAL